MIDHMHEEKTVIQREANCNNECINHIGSGKCQIGLVTEKLWDRIIVDP